MIHYWTSPSNESNPMSLKRKRSENHPLLREKKIEGERDVKREGSQKRGVGEGEGEGEGEREGGKAGLMWRRGVITLERRGLMTDFLLTHSFFSPINLSSNVAMQASDSEWGNMWKGKIESRREESRSLEKAARDLLGFQDHEMTSASKTLWTHTRTLLLGST
jgi:hypothetical protein